jgi:hypothetical protein
MGKLTANQVKNLVEAGTYEDGEGLRLLVKPSGRKTFRDWAGEMTPFPRDICELALAHDERGETESAYSRSDFFDKRRELMKAWAIYAISTPECADEAQRETLGE